MDEQERIMEAVDASYRGLPVEYHLRLGKRLVACVANWCREDAVEDICNDIRYHGRQIKSIYREDGKP